MRITTLFTDIGGVLLTNGWDHNSRRAAADYFKIDYDEFENRHQLIFGVYEEGKIDLHTYLETAVFYTKRSFSQSDFEQFMYAQSKPFEDMINLLRCLKEKNKIKIAVISNEGRELTEYRIKKFNLNLFIDFFVSSCFVGLKKPDPQIYRLALDLSQVSPVESVFIDDRLLFVEMAQAVGIKGIHHLDINTTASSLKELGLSL